MESVTWSRSHVPGFSWFILETLLPHFPPWSLGQVPSGVPLGDLSLYLRNTHLVTSFVLQIATQVQGSQVASLRSHDQRNSQWLESDFLHWEPRKIKFYSDPWSLLLVPQVGAVRDLAECFLLGQGVFCNVWDCRPSSCPIGALVFKANKILAFTLSSVRASTHEIHMD